MASSDLDLLPLDAEARTLAREAFELALHDLSQLVTARNRGAVSAALVTAIGSLMDAGQRDVERLRVYALSKGLAAARV